MAISNREGLGNIVPSQVATYPDESQRELLNSINKEKITRWWPGVGSHRLIRSMHAVPPAHPIFIHWYHLEISLRVPIPHKLAIIPFCTLSFLLPPPIKRQLNIYLLTMRAVSSVYHSQDMCRWHICCHLSLLTTFANFCSASSPHLAQIYEGAPLFLFLSYL